MSETTNNTKIIKCAMCGALIDPMKYNMEEYAYRKKFVKNKQLYLLTYCSYGCMRKAENNE